MPASVQRKGPAGPCRHLNDSHPVTTGSLLQLPPVQTLRGLLHDDMVHAIVARPHLATQASGAC